MSTFRVLLVCDKFEEAEAIREYISVTWPVVVVSTVEDAIAVLKDDGKFDAVLVGYCATHDADPEQLLRLQAAIGNRIVVDIDATVHGKEDVADLLAPKLGWRNAKRRSEKALAGVRRAEVIEHDLLEYVAAHAVGN